MAEETRKDVMQEYKGFNKELEGRILEANNDESKVKWSKLLPDLMGAEVFMVGLFTDQKNEQGENLLNVLMIQKGGHMIVPFFTSPDRMSVLKDANNSSFDVIKVNTVRFFQSIMGKPCVLNPLSPYARAFTPFEMKILAAENIDKAPPAVNKAKSAAE